jgi:glycosyltransferase involved in cell wall biosynthesis
LESGNKTYAYKICVALSAMEDVTLYVAVNSLQLVEWRQALPNTKIYPFGASLASPIKIIFENIFLRKLCNELKPDVYHSLCTLLPFWRPECLTVATIHDLNFLSFSQGLWRDMYKKYLYKYTLLQADRLITISKFTENEVNRFMKRRIDTNVIYHGVDAQAANPSRAGLTPFLLTFGHRPNKNVELAIDILKTLIVKDKKVTLKIVGKGQYIDKVVRPYVVANKLEEMVEFLGYVDDDELVILYAEALCLLFLSSYEGFGLPIIEAMAAGCPCVVSDLDVFSEMFSETALIVSDKKIDPACKYIESLLEQAAFRVEEGERAFSLAKKFSWSSAARLTKELCYQ